MPHKDACLLSDEQARQALGFCFPELLFHNKKFLEWASLEIKMYLCPQITKTKQDMEVVSIERSTYEVIGLPLRSSKNCWRASKASSQRWRRWLNEVTIWQPNSFTNPPQFVYPCIIAAPYQGALNPHFAFISGRNALIFQNRFAFTSFFRNFAADMQITNQQINIALALVAAGLLAVCIASVVSAIN